MLQVVQRAPIWCWFDQCQKCFWSDQVVGIRSEHASFSILSYTKLYAGMRPLALTVFGKKATRGILGGGATFRWAQNLVQGRVNIRFPFDNLELSVQKRSEMGLWPETLIWTRFCTPKMRLYCIVTEYKA